mmetsp:Transcript_4262/g.11835  ORF Transcript_4262/g.11835 Transcript_4262/m.11835 type:complete len:350 (+) Transcript_4262:1351-2400(+)
MVPSAKHVVPGRELLGGVAVKDVVVPLGRWTTPNMRRVEAPLLHKSQIFNQYGVVDGGAEAPRLEVVDRVEVGDVDPSTIRCRAVMVVFIDIHTKEEDVNSMNGLEEKDALGTDRELRGVSALGVALVHLIPHHVLLLHVRHHPNAQSLGLLYLVRATLKLFRLLFVSLVQRLVESILQCLAHLAVRQILGTFDGRHLIVIPFPLVLDVALRTGVGRGSLVLPTVKQRADLVDPPVAVIALDPRLLGQRVVFQLLQIGLLYLRTIVEDDGLVFPQQAEAWDAPVVESGGVGVVRSVPANALHPTRPIAVEDSGFEEPALGATQGTDVALSLEYLLLGFHSLLREGCEIV